MDQAQSLPRRFLLSAAIGAGITCGIVGLVSICLYAWTLGGHGASTQPYFTAVFVPTTLKLLLGGVVISIVLAAFLCRDAHRTAAAILISLGLAAVMSCGLGGLAILWSEWTPAPSPQPYPGIAAPYRFEDLGVLGRCASYTYEVDLPLPLARQHYEQQLKQYCQDPGSLAAVPRSTPACYEATCGIPTRPGAKQYFAVRICPVDSERVSIVHQDCWEEE